MYPPSSVPFSRIGKQRATMSMTMMTTTTMNRSKVYRFVLQLYPNVSTLKVQHVCPNRHGILVQRIRMDTLKAVEAMGPE